MLKLTQVLIKQSAQVYRRLSQYLSKMSDLGPGHDMEVGLNVMVIKGFFTLVDHMGQQVGNEVEKINTDKFLDVENCKAYLSSLSSSEVVVFFLAVEKIVMNSGKGQLFQSWRDSWQRTLIIWLQNAEASSRLKDQLSALLPLNDVQTELAKTHDLDLKILSQKIADYFSGYLEGRGALSQQLVILLNPSHKIPWSSITQQIQQLMQLDLMEATSDFVDKKTTDNSQVASTQYTAQIAVPFVTITRFLKKLLLSQSVKSYELINSFLYGMPLPKRLRKAPIESLRLWLLREVKALLKSSSCLPSCVLIENAEDLSQAELSFWAEIIESFRSLDQPFALILQPTKKTFDDEHTALHFFKRRMILCENFDESQGGLESSKLGERLSLWDQRWSLALVGYYQTDNDLKDLQDHHLPIIDFDIWLASFLKLAPNLQALLIISLSSLRFYFEGGPLATAQTDLFNKSTYQAQFNLLISAGWLKRVGKRVQSTTQVLESVVAYLSQSLDHLTQLTPKGAQALLALSSAILSEMNDRLAEHVLEIEQIRHINLKPLDSFTQWLKKLSLSLDQACPNEVNKALMLLKQLNSSVSSQQTSDLNAMKLINSLKHSAGHTPWLKSVSLESAELFEYQEELASTSGDLALLAKVFQLRAYWYCQKDLLLPMLDDLANAHQIFSELILDHESFECRASFILLLAQSGLVDLAKPLLNMEYQTQDFLQVEDEVCMIAGIVSAHQNEWSLALTYFAGVTNKTPESIIWEALSSLKSTDEFAREPQARAKLYQQIAHEVKEAFTQIDTAQIKSFDMYALYIWVQVLIMIILNQSSEFFSMCLRVSDLIKQEGLSRGHLYCAWSVQCMRSYHESLSQDKSLTQNESFQRVLSRTKVDLESAYLKAESAKNQVSKAWHNGYELILSRLQTDELILAKLFSPHAYVSQQKSLAHLPKSRTKHHMKLWELSELGDFGLFDNNKP